MVDISVLQPVSWVAAAIGVCIAAFYYVVNLRETSRNRRATLTNSMIQPFTTKEFAKIWLDLIAMKWDSFDDFKAKYDSRVNPDNFSTRMPFFNLLDSIGYQYRSGLIDIGTVYNVAGIWITSAWTEFGQVIKEYRKSDYPIDFYENWENLAGVFSEMRKQRDADYVSTRAATVLTSHQR